MRKKQRVIYSCISGVLLCAVALMVVIMIKNSKTVSALNLSDAMQMNAYNKLQEVQDCDVNAIADWLYEQALDTLESNGVSLTSANKANLRSIIEAKVLTLDSQGLIQYENNVLTSLAKGYLANITTEAVAEVKPDALEVTASGYTQVYDYSALQEQVNANRESVTNLSNKLQKLDSALNNSDGTSKYVTAAELEQTYNSLQTIIMSASYVTNNSISNNTDSANKDDASTTTPDVQSTPNVLPSVSNLSNAEYTQIVNNITNAVNEVKVVQTKLMSDYSDDVSSLETQLKAMSNVDSSLSAELNSVKEALTAASNSVSEVASTINMLSDTLMSKINATNTEVDKVNSSLAELKNAVSADNSDTASKISEIIDQIDTVSKNSSAETENLSSLYSELYTQIGNLDTEAIKDKEELYSDLTTSITELSNLTTSERVEMYEELTQSIADLSDVSEAERTAMYEELTTSIATVATTNAEERIELYNELTESISALENITNEERDALESRLTESITDLSEVAADAREELRTQLLQSISSLDESSAEAREELRTQLLQSISNLDEQSEEAREELRTQLLQSIENAATEEATLRDQADRELDGRLNVAENDLVVLKQFSTDTTNELESINHSIDDITARIEEAVADLEDANLQLSQEYGTTLVTVTTDLVNYMESMQAELEAGTDDIITDVNSIWTSLSGYANGLSKFNQDITVTTGWNLAPTTSTAGTIQVDLSPYNVTYDQLSNVDVNFDASAAPMTVSVSGSGSTLTLSIKPTEARFNGKSVKVTAVKLSVLGTANVLQGDAPSASGLDFDAYSGSYGMVDSGSTNGAPEGYTAEEGVVHQ